MLTRKSLQTALTAALALPFVAAGQTVELTSNFFIGTVNFNMITSGSAVDTILTNDFGMNAANLFAGSILNPIQYTGSNSTTGFPQVAPTTGRPYTVSAEADGGVGSVSYNLIAQATFGTFAVGKFFNSFNFNGPTPPNPLTLIKKPAPPTVANFQECVGIVEVNFGSNSCASPTTPINLGSPYIVSNGSLTFAQGLTSMIRHIVKPAAAPQSFTLHYTTGSDPFSDLIQNEILFQATASCNVVTPVCLGSTALPGTAPPCVGPSCPPTDLGEIIGEWDVVNELENANQQRTQIFAVNGIFGNYRWDNIGGENGSPNPPIFGAPPRPFELENLVPGNYLVYGQTTARLNRKYVFVQTDVVPAASVANQVTNLGNTFVMHPGFFYGDILLTHFPPASIGGNPASGLNDLYFSDAINVNGVPTSWDLSSGTRLGMSSGGSVSYTAWPFDSTNPNLGNTSYNQIEPGVFRSNYNLPVVRVNDVPGTWPDSGRTYFELRFDNNLAVPNPPRPNGNLVIAEAIAPQVLNPGAQRKIDFQYCFGSVNVHYRTATGTLYDPIADISGTYVGTLTALSPSGATLFTRSANYTTRASNFRGIPQNFANRASTGELTMTLPLGNYTLRPSMNVDDGSLTTFTPIAFSLLECNQVLDVTVGTPVPVRCDIDGDGDVDRLDIALIFNNRGKMATGINDPMDVNKDGVISVNDGRACTLACTRTSCKTELDM